jgi:hypothetical protein
MVGLDRRQTFQFDEAKMNGMKNVVERAAHQRLGDRKRRIQASADARVEQTADFLEKLRRPRPRDIV